jgi:hypothetical protein
MKRRSFFSQLAIAVTSAVFASSVEVFGVKPQPVFFNFFFADCGDWLKSGNWFTGMVEGPSPIVRPERVFEYLERARNP